MSTPEDKAPTVEIHGVRLVTWADRTLAVNPLLVAENARWVRRGEGVMLQVREKVFDPAMLSTYEVWRDVPIVDDESE